ncbi:MAG TPA: SCO family protein [Cyclobacteriaceae bacterium]|nr:SCO family protein [Cyclobacteriaceae bacterium]
MCGAIILLSFLSWQQQDEMQYLLKKIPDAEVVISDSLSRNISYWYSQKPVVLTIAYSRCPGVCNPYLLQIRDHISLQGKAIKDFQMMVLSFDPEDNPTQLHKLAGFTDDSPPPANWTFGVLEKKSKASLLSALGFQTQMAGELYDHNTVLVLIGTDGKILQRVEGLPANMQWNRLFKELTNEFVPVYSTLDTNVWMSCFRYDPASGTWRMNWGLLLILIPSISTVCLLLLLQMITNRERRNIVIQT